jgi:hypothetical protein
MLDQYRFPAKTRVHAPIRFDSVFFEARKHSVNVNVASVADGRYEKDGWLESLVLC